MLSVALESAWCVCAVSSTSLIYAQDFCFVSDKGLAAANPFLEHSKRPMVSAMYCEYTS